MSASIHGGHQLQLLPIQLAFVRNAHTHPFRFAIGDVRRPRMNFATALLTTLFLAQRLKPVWDGQEMTGIMLPPSVPAALVNFAAMFCGKVPVNLDYTASDEELQSCARECGLKTVITTKSLADRMGSAVPAETILLEKVAASPTPAEKLRAMLLWFRSAHRIEKWLGRKRPAGIDDVATVTFSMGVDGATKGVVLRHTDIASNIKRLKQKFALKSNDCVLGTLPFSDRFGFTTTLCLPAALGVSVVYHPSPIDVPAISELVRDYRVTFLPTLPEFLETYARECARDDFASLRHVLVGVEKMPDRLAIAFKDKFGIAPVEA